MPTSLGERRATPSCANLCLAFAQGGCLPRVGFAPRRSVYHTAHALSPDSTAINLCLASAHATVGDRNSALASPEQRLGTKQDFPQKAGAVRLFNQLK